MGNCIDEFAVMSVSSRIATEGDVMKVTDAMVEAAARAYGTELGSYFSNGRGYDQLSLQEIKIMHKWARAAIEAALAAYVKPTRAESARARWDAMTPEQRKLHTVPALKGRSEKRELRKVDDHA
jgi:hypothetical protein